MSINPQQLLRDQEARFERMRQANDAEGFRTDVLDMGGSAGEMHTFDVCLSEDPRIDVMANVQADGTFYSVSLRLHRAKDWPVTHDVEPGTAVWEAMSFWYADWRETVTAE